MYSDILSKQCHLNILQQIMCNCLPQCVALKHSNSCGGSLVKDLEQICLFEDLVLHAVHHSWRVLTHTSQVGLIASSTSGENVRVSVHTLGT